MASVSDFINIIPNLRCYARALTVHLSVADDLVGDCLRIYMKDLDDSSGDDARNDMFTLLHNLIERSEGSKNKTTKKEGRVLEPPNDRHVADGREPGLQMAFYLLDFSQKAVLFLIVIENFSDQEVAMITQIPVQRVRRVLRETLDQLSVLPLGLVTLSRALSK